MSDTPTPDEFGRYRVAETVDGRTRHYSTRRYIPGAHKIVTGPDSAASYSNGEERPAKFNTQDTKSETKTKAATADADSPKGATK